MSSHRLMSGLRRSRVSDVLVRKIQPRRWLAQEAALQRRDASVGKQHERVRHHVQGRPDADLLIRRLAVDHRGVGRAGHAALEFLLVAEPSDERLRRRVEREEMREDAPGRVREKRIAVVAVGKERRRQRERFGLVPHFIARTPERAATVERIENDVAARRIVELAEELSRRVVDDGRLASCLNLLEELPDEERLPRAGVADEEEVAGFELPRKTEGGPMAHEPCDQARALQDADAIATRYAD